MKLISINLQYGGGDRIDSILNYLIEENADLIVLGEYKDNEKGQKIQEKLEMEGYTIQSSDDELLGVLVASKYPFSLIQRERRIVGVELEDQQLKLLGVYVPTGSKDQLFKDAVWQKIIKFAQENQDIPSIITGDFNSCTKEDSMNQKQYNASDLVKLQSYGWIDTWSESKNDGERYTWYSSYGNGFRLDYAFISPELKKQIKNMNIYHDAKKRENEMTDHSPLIMEYSL